MQTEDILRWLYGLSASERELAPLPERLCLACVAVMGADGGAITADYTGRDRVTLFATDWVAGRLEDLQEVVGEGPGWDAHDGDDAVSCGLAETTSWPTFVPAALQELGSVSVSAAPIRAGAAQVGVLTLYWATAPTSAPDLAAVQFLADVVGAAFYRAPVDDLAEQVPWTNRARIHRATDAVAAQLGVCVEDAMVLLRAHAFASTTALSRVAEQVIRQELTFSPTHVGTGDLP